MEEIKLISGGVTAPKGFLAAGVCCGVKKSRRKDLALIYSRAPANAAGFFTTNLFKAAPIHVSQAHLKNGRAQAVVINSGNANSCTGKRGLKDATEMTLIAAESLSLSATDILVASTGVIGLPLPMEKIKKGITSAAQKLSSEGSKEAAQAIMTTDKFYKEIAASFSIKGTEVKIGGIAKGSGMIAPKLATMLAVITTDAVIKPPLLKSIGKEVIDKTFNMISVDGDTSTNDSVFLLANGLAGNEEIEPGGIEEKVFIGALEKVALNLARKIVEDGEGATKFVSVRVKGARTLAEARKAALSVVQSNLVKCAFFGEDPNWGRIMAALGNSGIRLNPAKVDLYFGDELVVRGGVGVIYCAQAIKRILKDREVEIVINLNQGQEEAIAWTTDLTDSYVKFNAKYKT